MLEQRSDSRGIIFESIVKKLPVYLTPFGNKSNVHTDTGEGNYNV